MGKNLCGRLAACGLWWSVVAASAVGLACAAAADDGGGTIVFSSDRCGPWRIWSVRPDGSELRQLTQAGRERKGRRSGVQPGRQTDPVLLDTGWRDRRVEDGRGRFTAERICDGDQAEWSPDGKQMVLRRNEQLYTRELATGREQAGHAPRTGRIAPAPPGAPTASRLPSLAAGRRATACSWSRPRAARRKGLRQERGLRAALVARRPADWFTKPKRNLFTIRPDGKKNRVVTFFGGVQRYGRFSPDGRSIVYCQGDSERGPWELYIIPATGGPPRQLTEGGSDMNPDWR